MSLDRSELKRLLGKPEPEPAEDGQDDPAGDGRDARHQTFAVQLVRQSRDADAVTYASISSPIRYDPSRGISFRFENLQGEFEVRVEGANLERIFDKLCQGKREVIRVAGNTVTAIHIVRVEAEA